MTAYDFDPTTHEYMGRESVQENPKRPGEYLLPTHSTLIEPPEIRDGHARVWNGEAWEYVEDHRGENIWRDHEICRLVAELGPIPEGWTIERPSERLTKEKLSELVYVEKSKVAYGGITLEKDGKAYLFATDPASIAMCNAMMIQLTGKPDDTPTAWKVYCGDTPVLLPLTKLEFERVFAAGMTMINQAFSVEGELNAELAALDGAGFETFRQDITARFETIGRTVE